MKEEEIRRAINAGERIGLLMRELALTYSYNRIENGELKFLDFLSAIEDLEEEIDEIINKADE